MKKEILNEVRNAIIGAGEILDYAIDNKNSRCNILIVSGNDTISNGTGYLKDQPNAELYTTMVYLNSLKGIDTIVVKPEKTTGCHYGYITINKIVKAVYPILEKEVGNKYHFHFFNERAGRSDTDKTVLSDKVAIYERMSEYLDVEIKAERLALRDKILIMYVYNNLCKIIDNDRNYYDARQKELFFWTTEKRYSYTKGKLETMLTAK
nr:MAG TPA: hypothetical protein [Caudoviricetes sp.]